VAPVEGGQPAGIGALWCQAGDAVVDTELVRARAFVAALAFEAEDLAQARPAAVLGGQGGRGLQRPDFDPAAVQVHAPGRGQRLGDDVGLGEQGRNVVDQGGLVGFDSQHIVAAAGDDGLHDGFLGQLGVTGDDPACEIEPFQESQGRADLVAARDGALGQHQPHLGGKGGQELQGRLAVAATAPHGLAIQRQRSQRRQPSLPPGRQGLFEGHHVQLFEDPMQGGDARSGKVREAQPGQERRVMVAAPLADRRQAAGPTQGRDAAQGQDRGQRMALAPRFAEIGDL